MKRFTVFFIPFFIIIALAGDACAPSPTPIATTEVRTPAPPTATAVPPTPTAVPQVRTLQVSSTADSGPGTLRQALLDAQNGDTITFDPAVFPPNAPKTIAVTSALPQINEGYLTIDASNAGVILDGSKLPPDSWIPGLEIVSDGNTIRGLQVINFTGTGIVAALHGRNNTIGGDRNIGAGPIGQGNLCSGNAFGIGLWDFASNNIVTGNLVGTDLNGTRDLGNRNSGVWVVEGGRENVIGPDNTIAYNSRCGVEIGDSESFGNTLTQNSIVDNGEAGICLVGGGNTALAAPLIIDFDVAGGFMRGTTCVGCKVEIFSDRDDEGAIYEGQVVADSGGVFTFNKGSAFTNVSITSTATDAHGNTSGFSQPAGLFEISVPIQEGNDSPGFLQIPRPSQELPDNHIGVWFENYDRYYDTDFVYRNGFKRIRIGSLAGRGQGWLTVINSESLSDEVDETISKYTNEDVEIVLILASGAGLPFGTTTFQSEEEFERYLEFVNFVVSHFKGRIDYYEIWNEPGHIPVRAYANLVERAVEVIRFIDPDAKIIIGAIQGDWVNGYPGYGEYQRFSVDIRYLNELLQSGVVHMVDGISWHPFYDNVPSDPYYQDYPEMFQSIKDLAASQGFTGEYFVDEILWTTVDEENWDNGPPVSQLIAAKYYTRTITEHRGLGVNVTIQTFFQVPFLAPIHNLCDILAGAEPTDIALSLETDANVRYYAFVLPNGERLVALWTNDVAVEEDYGVNATLTMSSFSAQSVIGIDVFHGFEQELITEMDNGDLVIRDLLVKDYPIILRLID
jgi:hypothetical protein